MSRAHGPLPRPMMVGLPTKQRVLTAIRWLYRRDGMPPSHSQIADVAGIATKRVRVFVERLATDGFLSYRKGIALSIELADRGAMLSDEELRLACVGRGFRVIDGPTPGLTAALTATYPVGPAEEGVADWGLNLLGELDDIPRTLPPSRSRPGSGGNGEAAGTEDQSIDADGDRRAQG